MRKIITHPIVLLFLMVVIASMLLVGHKQAYGFSWFGLWTSAKHTFTTNTSPFVQKTIENDIVLQIITAHGTLGGIIGSSVGGDLGIDSIPGYIAGSQRILMVDIVSYLENASDKATSLDSLIAQMNYYQTAGSSIQNDLQEIIQTQTSINTQCATAKTEGDRTFYEGLKGGDASMVQQGLEESQKNGACQASSRISINGHTTMLQRVQYMQSKIQLLSTLLQQSHQTILDNFSLFKDSNLEKLLSLRDEIRAKSPGTQ